MTDEFGFEPFDDADYPDVEIVLMAYLADAGKTVTQIVTMDQLPVIRIQRIGGGEGADPETEDNPRVSIQCFDRPSAANPRASQRVAADVVRRMTAINQGRWVAGITLDSATKDSGPVSRPWDDPEIRVTELIYSVTMRT